MKIKSFFFLMLTLVSFLSCDSTVPKPDRNPVISADTISTVTVNGEELVLATTVGNKTVSQSICNIMTTRKLTLGQLGDIRAEDWGDWILITEAVNNEAITSFYYKSSYTKAPYGKLIAKINTTSWLICGKGDFITFAYSGPIETQFTVVNCTYGMCELSYIKDGVEVFIGFDKYNLGKIRLERYLDTFKKF